MPNNPFPVPGTFPGDHSLGAVLDWPDVEALLLLDSLRVYSLHTPFEWYQQPMYIVRFRKYVVLFFTFLVFVIDPTSMHRVNII
jgi:hypothetical protein